MGRSPLENALGWFPDRGGRILLKKLGPELPGSNGSGFQAIDWKGSGVS